MTHDKLHVHVGTRAAISIMFCLISGISSGCATQALVSILPTAAKLFGYTGKMTGNILAYVTDALGLCSAPMTAGHCAQRDRLLRECRRTLDKYAAAVAELSRKMGISSLDDYLKLHQAAEAAHVRLNEAHDRLAHHIAEHHCDVSKASNPRLA